MYGQHDQYGQHDHVTRLFIYLNIMECSCILCIERCRFKETAILCSLQIKLFKIVQNPDYWQNYSHDIIKTWLYKEQIFWMEDL